MRGKKNKTIGEGRRKAGNRREKLLDAVAIRRMFHERANERATQQRRSTPCERNLRMETTRSDTLTTPLTLPTPTLLTPNPETGTTIFVTEFRGD